MTVLEDCGSPVCGLCGNRACRLAARDLDEVEQSLVEVWHCATCGKVILRRRALPPGSFPLERPSPT